MKSKLIKITLIVLTLVLLFNSYSVNATTIRTDPYDPVTRPDFWQPEDLGNEDELVEKAEGILGFINIIGVVCSVISLLIIGFKYVLGSVEEKAGYKQELMPYLIGAVLVFAATTIPNVIFNLTKGLFA